MRILVLMRGIPASGKSTWIANMGLEQYTLSPDSLRLMASSPVLLPKSKILFSESTDIAQSHTLDSLTLIGINQQNDKQVWKILFTLLEMRLKQGDFTIIDATHTSHKALRAYEALANTYRYRLIVVDFSHIPLEVALQRNAHRGYKSVPSNILESMYATLQDSLLQSLPSRYLVLKSDEIAPPQDKTCQSMLHFNPINLNVYTQIHHIGDIHGCFDALLNYLISIHSLPHSLQDALHILEQSQFTPQICALFLNPQNYYIFLGDYIDRGVQNAQVVRFLLGIMDLPNVCLLEGNHERWLYKWGKEELGTNEFSTFTKKDLEQGGIGSKDAHRLYSKLRQCCLYTYDNKIVLCTHGGLPTLPPNLLLVSTKQLIYGSGGYEDMQGCAKSFTLSTTKDTYQVFGHRNREKHSIRVYERNFALEGGVEFGGALRAVVLTKTSLPPFNAIKTLRTHSQLYMRNSLMGMHTSKDNFTQIYMQNKHCSQELNILHQSRSIFSLLQKLRASALIKEKAFGHISSFNFTKEAFFSKQWNSLTCKARGLFIDTYNFRICARAYDKFFNYKEREPYNDEGLKATLQYPVNVFIKENGFLGIVSAKSANDSLKPESKLFITSKSDPTSPFADIARNLIEQTLQGEAQDLQDSMCERESQLYEELKTRNLSLIFEIIHPQDDPHIIAYEKPQVILLDAIYNTLDYAKLPFDELCALGEKFGFVCKEYKATLHCWEEVSEFLQRDETLSLFSQGKRENGFIEGYVFEDNAGFMFKYKGAYYRAWKAVREIIEQCVRTRELPKSKGKKWHGDSVYYELEEKFIQWLCQYIEQNGFESIESTSLIALRETFLRSLAGF
ncbi:AAA family ATPase [Helicobacter sp. MIT 21-1697]|uniref:RNA ligase n=1 Tax=Helicobacter sp. MIT 21-1697 TaxID=2993733 RepID=UPI00224B1893|nr:RNA ligase [Helicobacter sp. MIT 21-1697]MCX2716695.1 AAA family ATPase [Helicobacter sp. MIT 21-1697]